MKPEQLSIPAKDLHRARLTDKQGPALPEPTHDELLRMTVTAAWANRMLELPVYSARKCPVLPSFIPRAVGQGVTVVHDTDPASSSSSLSHSLLTNSPPNSPPPPPATQSRFGFHSGPLSDDAPARCPYQRDQ